MRIRTSTLVMTSVVLLGGVPSVALSAPGSEQHQATSGTLRDAADDVLLSDGNPTYTGKEVSSTRITDYPGDAAVDHFQFQAWQKRRVRINTDFINGGTPVTCSYNYVVFKSATTPNWYETLTSGAQPSVPSDAFFTCHTDGGFGAEKMQWRITYPDYPNECAVIERLDATTWRFSVPPYVVDPETQIGSGCPATLSTHTQERGKDVDVIHQTGISAPMELTVVIP